MNELVTNQQVGKLLEHLNSQNLKPEEKLAALHATISVIEQVRIQQVISEQLANQVLSIFSPYEKKIIN